MGRGLGDFDGGEAYVFSEDRVTCGTAHQLLPHIGRDTPLLEPQLQLLDWLRLTLRREEERSEEGRGGGGRSKKKGEWVGGEEMRE